MRSLWHYCKDDPIDKTRDPDSIKFKLKLTNNTNNECTVNVKRVVPLNYLSNFWRNLEIPLTNCEINLMLIWSEDFVI